MGEGQSYLQEAYFALPSGVVHPLVERYYPAETV